MSRCCSCMQFWRNSSAHHTWINEVKAGQTSSLFRVDVERCLISHVLPILLWLLINKLIAAFPLHWSNCDILQPCMVVMFTAWNNTFTFITFSFLIWFDLICWCSCNLHSTIHIYTIPVQLQQYSLVTSLFLHWQCWIINPRSYPNPNWVFIPQPTFGRKQFEKHLFNCVSSISLSRPDILNSLIWAHIVSQKCFICWSHREAKTKQI